MWSISLLPKEHYGSRNYADSHFGQIGAFAVTHKNTIIVIIATLLALALVLVLQHAVFSKRNSTEQPAKHQSTTVSTQTHKEDSTPTTVESNITTEQNSPADPQVRGEVRVNNQSVPVPENGSTSRTIVDDNGTTKVDIHVNSSTQGTSKTHSSTTFNLDSKSKSESVVEEEVSE